MEMLYGAEVRLGCNVNLNGLMILNWIYDIKEDK